MKMDIPDVLSEVYLKLPLTFSLPRLDAVFSQGGLKNIYSNKMDR